MKKKMLLTTIVFFIMTLPVPAFAKVFRTSDFAGNWYLYGPEVNLSIPAVYWVRGNVDIDKSGKLTGTYYAPDGSSVTLSSGQLYLDNKGIISGSFAAEGATTAVVHGKLDESKTFGTSVLVGIDGTMDVMTSIKGGGTFVPTDIQGSWDTYITAIDTTTGVVYWAYGTADVDSSGEITGLYYGPDGSTLSVTGGEMLLSNEGIITGSISSSTGDTSLIVHGKMDQGKTFGMFVSLRPTDGSMRIGYLNKAGGTFKQSDAAGNWYVYSLNIDPTIPAVYWAYGKAGIDALGNITGSYIAPTGKSVKLTSTFQMNNEGLSTGTFNFDTGDFGILPSIKLDQGKTSMAGVSVITSGSSVGSMSILQFIKESNTAMPWIPLLLLDEETFALMSSSFSEGAPIPVQHSLQGGNLSPPLSWSNLPANTKSFVLIMVDPDAPGGTWDHWIAYNIPAGTTSLAENAGASGSGGLPSGAVHGTNSWGNNYYQGPSPPSGTHRYYFKLYALSVSQLNPSGTNKAAIEAAMQGKILNLTQLMGTYTHTP